MYGSKCQEYLNHGREWSQTVLESVHMALVVIEQSRNVAMQHSRTLSITNRFSLTLLAVCVILICSQLTVNVEG